MRWKLNCLIDVGPQDAIAAQASGMNATCGTQYAQRTTVGWLHPMEVISGMAGERSVNEEWETKNLLRAREAQDADDEWQVGPAAYEPYERIELPDFHAIGEPAVDWSDQPTQPQRRIEARRDWPAQPSGPHPEWPLRSESGVSASPLHRLLDAAHERQF